MGNGNKDANHILSEQNDDETINETKHVVAIGRILFHIRK